MLACDSEHTQASGLPMPLLERLTSSWQAACISSRSASFQRDVLSLCERYDAGHSAKAAEQSLPHSSRAQGPDVGTQQRTHVDQLPDEVLARILRFTLDPEHPGSLCSSTYLSDLKQHPELMVACRYPCMPHLPQHFSHAALLCRGSVGPLPFVLVCKRWRDVVVCGDVVRVLAANVPSGLPPSVRTLMLRLYAYSSYKRNVLTFPRGLPQLQELVCGCPVWREPGKRLHTQAFLDLFAMLPSFRCLTRLVVSHCRVPARALRDLECSLDLMKSLRSLSLLGLHNRDSALGALAPFIGRLTHLTHLHLSQGCQTSDGFKRLILHVTQLSELQSLKLEDIISLDELPDHEDQRSLCGYLTALSGLQHLDLQEGLLDEALLEEALQAFVHCSALRTLALGLLSTGFAGAATIFSSSALMRELRELRLLSNDYLREDDVLRLAPFLGRPAVPLRRLAVSGSACQAFLDVMGSYSSALIELTALDLRLDVWEKRDRDALAACLPGLTGLQALKLAGSDLDYNNELLEPLAREASCLTSLRSLALVSADLQSDDCPMLSGVLERLVNLEALDLRYNNLESMGVQDLAQKLGGMHELQELLLNGNSIGPSGALALVPYLSKWPAMTRLGLDFVGFLGHSDDSDHSEDGTGFTRDDAQACMLLFAAHIVDEDRLAMLHCEGGIDCYKEWRRLRDLWTAPV